MTEQERLDASEIVSQLVAIDGCICEGLCGHWQAEAGIILTAALRDSQPIGVSLSVLTGYEAALREVQGCEKCEVCEDHLPSRE